jgi:hypothetical protein
MSFNLGRPVKKRVSRPRQFKIQTDLTENSFEMNSFINKMDYLQHNLNVVKLNEKIEKRELNNNEEFCSWNSLIISNN